MTPVLYYMGYRTVPLAPGYAGWILCRDELPGGKTRVVRHWAAQLTAEPWGGQ